MAEINPRTRDMLEAVGLQGLLPYIGATDGTAIGRIVFTIELAEALRPAVIQAREILGDVPELQRLALVAYTAQKHNAPDDLLRRFDEEFPLLSEDDFPDGN